MKTIFHVENMKCSGCSANVEQALEAISTIESIEINLDEKTVEIEGKIDVQAIKKVISDAGYPAQVR